MAWVLSFMAVQDRAQVMRRSLLARASNLKNAAAAHLRRCTRLEMA